MELKRIIVEKITSGKFIITVISGVVFAYLSMKGILPVDKVHDVILIVIYAYFTKKSEEPKEGV